ILSLNANWVFRVGKSGGTMIPIAASGNYSAFQTSGTSGADALANVLMLSGFWGKDQGRYADLTAFRENWGRSFLVLVPVMALGLWSAWRDPKRRPLAAALVVAALAAAFLAVGVRLPVARDVSLWMFAHVPGYNGMRETQKWAAAEVIAYGTLLAWGMARLFQTKRVRDNRRVTLVASGAVIVLFAPLLLLGLNGSVKPVEYPDDWQTLSASLESSGCAGSTLFLPWHMYMGFSWIGRVVANPAEEFFPCRVIQGTNMEWNGIYDNSGSTKGAAVEAWLRSGGNDAAGIEPYDVRRIILAKDADWNEYAWIDARPEWKLVSETETLRVYEPVP
ncbi:hypothetical protein EBS80_03135, partial [bacterium]|nr:hypothetical protein [bacterium]